MSEFKYLEEINNLFNNPTTHKEGTLEHRTAVRNINTRITALKDVISRLSKKSSTGVASAADTPLQADTPEPDEIIILAGLMILEKPDEKKDFWRRLLKNNKEIFEKAKLKKAEFLEFLESKPDVVQEEPVVSVPELQPVSYETVQSELRSLSRFFLNAIYALLTQIGVKKNHTKCDNEHKYSDLCSTIKNMLSGKIPSNDMTHRAVKDCRNKNRCDDCRGLCLFLTILRFPDNLTIDDQVCRCVWNGSRFAKEAIVALIRLRIGPNSLLALMIEQGHDSLHQFLLELNVGEETPDEKHEREQNDQRVRTEEKRSFEKKSQILRIAGEKGDKRDTKYTPFGSSQDAKKYAKEVEDQVNKAKEYAKEYAKAVAGQVATAADI